MSECNCSCSPVTFEVCHNGCCCDNSSELDCIIANLKSELFEKQQNVKDYCALESKVIQLQNDIKLLCEQKKCLECELCRTGEEGDQLICNLRAQNINLKNELNDKNSLNKKLYGDNNNLFQVLEGKTNDNQNLQDQMCHQENILQRLNIDKTNLENTIHSLTHLKDKHMKDIQDLNIQINLLNKNTNDLDNTLRNKNCQNLQIINEFNNEKNINTDLVNVLKNKECALAQIQQELCMANETLTRLDNDINNLNFANNQNKDEIACTSNNLAKETSIRNGLENQNAKLNCLINDRNAVIQTLTNENNILKCNNTNVNSDNNCLCSKIDAYKKHILILTDQNEKLSAELEAILSRDSNLLFTLGRDSHLRVVQNENNNAINSSLDYLKACSSYNGNVNVSKCNNVNVIKCNHNINNINNINNVNNGNEKRGSFGMNLNGSKSGGLYNSRGDLGNDIRKSGDQNQYSGGEEEQYSGGEEMQYSSGEEGLGQSSGEENQ